jgi:hypothetical protein
MRVDFVYLTLSANFQANFAHKPAFHFTLTIVYLLNYFLYIHKLYS